MSKHQKSNKESKKNPLLTPKEKRAAKRDKDSDNAILGSILNDGKNARHPWH